MAKASRIAAKQARSLGSMQEQLDRIEAALADLRGILERSLAKEEKPAEPKAPAKGK